MLHYLPFNDDSHRIRLCFVSGVPVILMARLNNFPSIKAETKIFCSRLSEANSFIPLANALVIFAFSTSKKNLRLGYYKKDL